MSKELNIEITYLTEISDVICEAGVYCGKTVHELCYKKINLDLKKNIINIYEKNIFKRTSRYIGFFSYFLYIIKAQK